MSAVMSTGLSLVAQDEAIDSYLAGLLTEVASVPDAAPARPPIPFVRGESLSSVDALAAVSSSEETENECGLAESMAAQPASLDLSTAASAWHDPLALELPEEFSSIEAPLIDHRANRDSVIGMSPEGVSSAPDDGDFELTPAPANAICVDSMADRNLSPEPMLIDPAIFNEAASVNTAAPAEVAVVEGGRESAPQLNAPGVKIASMAPPAEEAVEYSWQFFTLGALTVALPTNEIHSVVKSASLMPVKGAPTSLVGALQHAGRWSPVASLNGWLPSITGDSVVVLFGEQGLWGVQLGMPTNAPSSEAMDAMQWRSDGEAASDRPWLMGINPSARLVVLKVSALRRLLDGRDKNDQGN